MVEHINAVTSSRETIRLQADFCEAMFTETITTELSAVKHKLAMCAGVGFFLWKCKVETEEDDEGDADN